MGKPLNSCAKLSLIVLSCWGGGMLAEDNEVTVSSVEGLVAELASCDGVTPKTILLQVGDYQLTSAQQSTNSSYGISHLSPKAYVTIKGGGTNPEDTKLIGDGVTGRIMYLSSNTITLENLTLTNGVTVDASGGSAKRGAALAGKGVITNCLIIGNTSLGIGGGVSSSSKTDGMQLWNCRILNNSGSTGGGAYYARLYDCIMAGNIARTGEGGGGYECTLVGGVVSNNATQASKDGGGLFYSNAAGTGFVCNESKQKGGAVYRGVLTNCWFAGNFAKRGAAASNATLIDCKIYDNTASVEGGGIYASTADRCEIWNNYVSGSGGAASFSTLTNNCKIFCNFATSKGGGLYGCTSEVCVVWDNFANGNGGGVCEGIIRYSVISNNFTGATGYNACSVDIYDSVISGMSISYGQATRCIFTNIGDVQSLTRNPHYTTNQQSYYAYSWYPNATNCLFVGNNLTTSSSSLFCGVQLASRSSLVVNCTIVSNKYNYLARYCWDPEYPLLMQNTVIYDNFRYGTSTPRDIYILTDANVTESNKANRCSVGAFILDHCVYKTKPAEVDLVPYTLDDSLYRFGTDGFAADPGFMLAGDSNHPFSLKRTSTLRGRGRPLDWMNDAYDLRGDADNGKYRRLRDGKVDIGCYQCWIDSVALRITIR